MRGPAELAARAAVRYQRVYAAWAANPEQARAEVLPLSLDPPTQDLALADVDGVAAWIAAWRQWEHSAPGTVTWEGRRWASLGTQHLPVRAQLVGADAIASAAGRAGHWGLASSRAEMIAEMLQALGVGPTGLPGQGGAAEAVAAVISERGPGRGPPGGVRTGPAPRPHDRARADPRSGSGRRGPARCRGPCGGDRPHVG